MVFAYNHMAPEHSLGHLALLEPSKIFKNQSTTHISIEKNVFRSMYLVFCRVPWGSCGALYWGHNTIENENRYSREATDQETEFESHFKYYIDFLDILAIWSRTLKILEY